MQAEKTHRRWQRIWEETCELEPAIEAFITDRDHVTFAELVRAFRDAGADTDGGHAITLGIYENIVLWYNLSNEMSAAIRSLQETGAIRAVPTTTLVYMIDGTLLDLPIAKQRRQYKALHWLPVVLRPGKART